MQSVLTIAGFDPSSGAGVTADLMVFAAHGLFGTACITALTIQNTTGVRSIEAVPAQKVTETLDFLTSDIQPAGVKIGMLAQPEVVSAVAEFLRRLPHRMEIPVVLDPIVRSSSGRELVSSDGLRRIEEDLLPEVDWITPNVEELGTLLGIHTPSEEEIVGAAQELQARYSELHMVITGGHLFAPDDLLLVPGAPPHWLRGTRVETRSTHGTGCSYSSALLSRLVLGDPARDAAQTAKSYVEGALRAADPVGSGHGPLNHLWPLR